MAILNAFSGGGGLIRIPLEAPTDLVLTERDGAVLISWTDPVDKVATPGGEMVAEWNYSIVVRNTERVPVSPGDGVEIVRTQTRNQYQSTQYTDDLYIENGVTYYYAVFAVTTIGTASESISSSATPTAATPEFYKSISYSPENYPNSAISNTENHIVIIGGYNRSGTDTEYSENVTTFTREFTKGTLSRSSRSEAISASFNGHAIFAAGGERDEESSTMSVYTPSLSKREYGFTNPKSVGVEIGLATSPTHILIGGGRGKSNVVSAFDSSFTRTNPTTLPEPTGGHSGSMAGEYGVFGGGTGKMNTGYDSCATVTAYSSTLTRVTATETLYQHIDCKDDTMLKLGTASVGPYALFAGGRQNGSSYVTAYNSSLTRMPALTLNNSTTDAKGGSVGDGNYAIFISSQESTSSSHAYSAVYFDSSLTKAALTMSGISSYQYQVLQPTSGTIEPYIAFFTAESNGSTIHVFQCV